MEIQKQGIGVEKIFESVRGYWKSAVIMTSIDLDIFTQLKDPKTSTEISNSLNTNLKATERLLDALVNLNLIQYTDSTYQNTAITNKYMVSSSPHFIGHIIMYHKTRYTTWGELTQAIKTGKPLAQASFLTPDQQQINNYARAMSARARLEVDNVMQFIRLEGCQKLLDLGGAPGTFASAFANRYQSLQITVFDLPDMIEITKEITVSIPSIEVIAGDFISDEIGENYCAVFLSQILDSLGIKLIKSLFQKVYAALKPGGQILIRDFIIQSNHAGPEIAIYRNLNVFLTSGNSVDFGEVLDINSFKNILQEVGFKDLKFIELSGLSDLIIGIKN